MISKSKLLLVLCFCSWITGCNFESEYFSPIPASEQVIIRRILNVNGYNLSDKELVDPYIGKVTDFHSGVWYGEYNLIIPKRSHSEMILTDDINNLNSAFFAGDVFPPNELLVDTIIIQTDSVIYMPRGLSAGNYLRSIPSNINKIRTRFLNLRDNQLTTLPEEIMELTTPPFPFDTFGINISGNPIDTATLSDTLKKWLKRYSTFATDIPEKTYW